MRYYLNIWSVEPAINPIYTKESDDKNELENLVKQYKDPKGEEYYVEIAEETGFVGENNNPPPNLHLTHNNLDIPIFKLNEDIKNL